jgi:hypothetical protein
MSETTDLFLRATKAHLRFPSCVGELITEDLWDLPLSTTRASRPSLEKVGTALLKQQTELGAGSILVDTSASPEKACIDLMVEVVRAVAVVKHAENTAKTTAAARKSEAHRLDQIIAEREVTEASLEELKARRANL